MEEECEYFFDWDQQNNLHPFLVRVYKKLNIWEKCANN